MKQVQAKSVVELLAKDFGVRKQIMVSTMISDIRRLPSCMKSLRPTQSLLLSDTTRLTLVYGTIMLGSDTSFPRIEHLRICSVARDYFWIDGEKSSSKVRTVSFLNHLWQRLSIDVGLYTSTITKKCSDQLTCSCKYMTTLSSR